MTQPLALDTIIGEFDQNDEAWVLQDRDTGKYVIIPDNLFPGRKPVRFFMRREDAEAILIKLNDVNPKMSSKDLSRESSSDPCTQRHCG